jgi:hypothetical protein
LPGFKLGSDGSGIADGKLVTGPRGVVCSRLGSEPITGPTSGLTNEPGKGEPKSGLMIELSKGFTEDVTGFSRFVTGFSRFVTGFNKDEVKPLTGLMTGLLRIGVSETGDASSVRASRNSTFKYVDGDLRPIGRAFCQDRNQWVNDIGVIS